MNLERFNSYCEEDKNMILEDMFELYSLVTDYPTSVEDLRVFVEWQMPLGKFGEDMKDLLYGVYPSERCNYTKEEIIQLSDNALKFVNFWNKYVNNK